ncbi:MAG: hypothetical protein WAO35_15075 [Terriglobia bacterium]
MTGRFLFARKNHDQCVVWDSTRAEVLDAPAWFLAQQERVAAHSAGAHAILPADEFIAGRQGESILVRVIPGQATPPPVPAS